MEFCYDNTTVTVRPGSLIYLPHASKHFYRAVCEHIRYIRLDFEMYSAQDNKMIVFAKHPTLITDNTDYAIIEILTELAVMCTGVKYAAKLKANAL